MKIVVTHPIPGPAIAMLRARGHEVTVGSKDGSFEREELGKLVAGADAVLTLHYDDVDAAFFQAAGPQLKIVANFGVGYEHIDLGAAKRHGVKVTNTPEVLNQAVAEHTIALMLAVARRLTESDRFVREQTGEPWHSNLLLGSELKGKTLGVVGPGRIGRITAEIARKGLRMKLVYMDIERNEELESEYDAERLALEHLLERADVVVLHVPLSRDTEKLIGPEELRRMKRTAILVNTSRGEVVDENALVQALRAREIAGAGLDVFADEPEPHKALLDLDNVVLTPHTGSATIEAREQMSWLAAENIIAALEGKELPSEVTGDAESSTKERGL